MWILFFRDATSKMMTSSSKKFDKSKIRIKLLLDKKLLLKGQFNRNAHWKTNWKSSSTKNRTLQ